ncbi:MAG TPA: hypothetical protein VF903_07585 [Nitrospirota bacterium]
MFKPYSKDMKRLNQKGVTATTRPSGHNIKSSFDKIAAGGSIPPNVIEEELPFDMLKFGNNAANDPYTLRCKEAGLNIHPAVSPLLCPSFSSNCLQMRATSSLISLRAQTQPASSRSRFTADGLRSKTSKTI